ncbi:MAG: hypothetical protein J0H74_27700 [Chitinophagaceae bacterium]|nr:hypothetical protein [Chitinophagaceae bacterium]
MQEPTIGYIKEKIREILVNDLDANIDPASLRDDLSLYDDGLGLDSIAIINFIVLVEQKFDITFEGEEISSKLFGNINNLAEFIEVKLRSQVDKV